MCVPELYDACKLLRIHLVFALFGFDGSVFCCIAFCVGQKRAECKEFQILVNVIVLSFRPIEMQRSALDFVL